MSLTLPMIKVKCRTNVSDRDTIAQQQRQDCHKFSGKIRSGSWLFDRRNSHRSRDDSTKRRQRRHGPSDRIAVPASRARKTPGAGEIRYGLQAGGMRYCILVCITNRRVLPPADWYATIRLPLRRSVAPGTHLATMARPPRRFRLR